MIKFLRIVRKTFLLQQNYTYISSVLMFWNTKRRVFDSEVNMVMSCMKRNRIYVSMLVTELQNGMLISLTIYNLPFCQYSFSCLSYHPE